MLDAFASILVAHDTKASLEDELAAEFKKLGSVQEISKVASAIYTMSKEADCGSDNWLEKYEGTPLYDKAVELEEEALNIEAERIKSRIEKEKDQDFYAQEDMVRLKKKMLDLDLVRGGKAESSEPTVEPMKAASVKLALGERPRSFGDLATGVLGGHGAMVARQNKGRIAALEAAQGAPAPVAKVASTSEQEAPRKAGLSEILARGAGGMGGAYGGAELGRNAARLLGAGRAGQMAGDLLGIVPGAVVGSRLSGAAVRKLQQGLDKVDPQGKTASADFVDLAGRSMAHAFHKMAKKEEKSKWDAKTLATLGALPVGGAALGAGMYGLAGAGRAGAPLATRLARGAGLGGAIGLGTSGLIAGHKALSDVDPEGKAFETAARLLPAAGMAYGAVKDTGRDEDKYAAAVMGRRGISPFVGSLQKEAFLGAALGTAGKWAATKILPSVAGEAATKALGGAAKWMDATKLPRAVGGKAVEMAGKVLPGGVGNAVQSAGRWIGG